MLFYKLTVFVFVALSSLLHFACCLHVILL